MTSVFDDSTLHHQTMISISFWYRRELNSKFLLVGLLHKILLYKLMACLDGGGGEGGGVEGSRVV